MASSKRLERAGIKLRGGHNRRPATRPGPDGGERPPQVSGSLRHCPQSFVFDPKSPPAIEFGKSYPEQWRISGKPTMALGYGIFQ
jgi:hypothetical protein